MVVEAALRCAMVPAANTLLGPLVNRINRTPIDTMHAEVTNSVTVIAHRLQRKATMQELEDALADVPLPPGDLVVGSFDAEDVAIEVTLLATSVEGGPWTDWWNGSVRCRRSGRRSGAIALATRRGLHARFGRWPPGHPARRAYCSAASSSARALAISSRLVSMMCSSSKATTVAISRRRQASTRRR